MRTLECVTAAAMELQQQNRDQQQQQLESPLQRPTRELDDELFHRRRARWLVYGRAILTIAALGLLTVVLYSMTHQRAPAGDEQRSRMVFGGVPSSQSVSVEDETVVKLNEEAAAAAVEHRSKRNVPKIVVNSRSASARESLKDENDIQFDSSSSSSRSDEIGHVEKLQRRVVNQAHHNSHRHRHSDGDLYYLKGYKCVPVTKSSSTMRRNRPRLPGMFELELNIDNVQLDPSRSHFSFFTHFHLQYLKNSLAVFTLSAFYSCCFLLDCPFSFHTRPLSLSTSRVVASQHCVWNGNIERCEKIIEIEVNSIRRVYEMKWVEIGCEMRERIKVRVEFSMLGIYNASHVSFIRLRYCRRQTCCFPTI